MQGRIGLNRNTVLLAVVIVAAIGSVLAVSIVFIAPNVGSKKLATYEGRYFDRSRPTFSPLRQRQASLPGRSVADFHGSRWSSGVAARTKAFPVHRDSAALHWKQSWPGNMRKPSTTIPTVTSDQAKTKVSDAIREFKVGEAKDTGNLWMVSIKYKDSVVMTVLLGKLNTPTSEDAVKAVQDSMAKGWKAGEPKQLQSIYNVPIIDARGNTVGNIRVDGRSGEITSGFLVLRR